MLRSSTGIVPVFTEPLTGIATSFTRTSLLIKEHITRCSFCQGKCDKGNMHRQVGKVLIQIKCADVNTVSEDDHTVELEDLWRDLWHFKMSATLHIKTQTQRDQCHVHNSSNSSDLI